MTTSVPDDMDMKMQIGDGEDVKILEDGTIIDRASTGEERRISAGVAIDPVAERRLVWKFDLRILPTLAIMYLFNA